MQHVHACAKLVVIPKATPQIQRTAYLRVRGVVQAHASNWRVFGTFRLKVDHPTDTTARRAIQQGICAFEDFHALQHLGIHDLTWHHAGQAAHGHVIAIELKAANTVGLSKVTVTLHRLHARIIADHIGDGFRLLIGHQL